MTAGVMFALAMTFSPGPNNIMSASLGMMYGYQRALRFILGVVGGFTIVMLLGSFAALALLSTVPDIQPILKYVGAAYITYLAWTTWSHRHDFGTADGAEMTRGQGPLGGFALQFANPKAMATALVLYSTFFQAATHDLLLAVASAAGMAVAAFAATSTWALAGTAIRRWLNSDERRMMAAGVLAAALVYTAIELAGVLG